jgi:hypothetical protein
MSTKTRKAIKRNPANFNTRDLREYIIDEVQKTGKSKEEILEETFHDGYVVISESGDGAFKVEGGQLFKPTGEKVDDLTECRRLRERFGPIAACVEYIKDIILGSGIDVVLNDITDSHQKDVKKELQQWMDNIYQDVYTIGLNSLLNILVDNALTDGFAAAEIVYETDEDYFSKYAKPITSSSMSQESGKLAKSDYISYEITDPIWSDLKGISRLKIFLDAPTRLRLYRKGRTWEADYWVLDQPNVAGAQAGMTSSSQKNLQQGTPMQLTSADLVRSTLVGSKQVLVKPSAYFLPWQIFSLSVTRRNWLEKGPSIILPAMKTAQLLEKIMNAVGEGIYRAGNKKYFIICGTKDRPWGAIHIRNLLSQIKDASEKNWSTIPVPAGFDLKEAGGQVFEAQNAINYFLRVIAGIMHVNASVLGLDAREGRNVTDFSYSSHIRLKQEMLNQIRTQLFRLHIWAKYGEKKSKQGGYNEPTLIPTIRAMTEDLLNPADRLKLDIDILNAANPVMPQTKLEVERDIVKTRGWEVILPSQEEFMIELKKKQEEDEAFKKEQRNAQIKNMQQPKAPEEKGDKTMGPPSPPSAEKQQKRQEAGMNKQKVGAKETPPRGSTRTPAEAKRQVQESIMIEETIPQVTKVGDTFTIANPFNSPSTASKEEFAGITIEVVELSGDDGYIVRYNRDLTKIYMDPLVPVEFYKPMIAREILEYIFEQDMDYPFKEAERMATNFEIKFVKKLGISPDVYARKCAEIVAEVSKRTGIENPPDVVEHDDVQESEQKPVEHQKVDVNITVEAKQPEKTQHEITIKTEPLQVKTEKQEVEVKLKQDLTLTEDPEKKKEEADLRKKKKEILEKMDKKLKEDE